ncbi:MAG TPA: pilin [Verrucomicrobiae bacterium]|nr:pilin [Verrucomicrobiae bacterium]
MKLRKLFVGITAMLTLAAPLPILAGTAAADPSTNCGNSPAAKEVLTNLASSEIGADCGQSRVNNIFQTVVTIMSIIVGIASVLVIIYAGMKYITSAGDSNKVSNAKSTLIYALVGLAVAGLAQFLIHFVLFQANQTGQPPKKSPSSGPSSFIQVKRPDEA